MPQNTNDPVEYAFTVLGAQMASRIDPEILKQHFIATPDAPDVLAQTANLLRVTLMVDVSFYLGQGELSAKYVQAYHEGLIQGLTDDRSDWDDILKGMLWFIRKKGSPKTRSPEAAAKPQKKPRMPAPLRIRIPQNTNDPVEYAFTVLGAQMASRIDPEILKQHFIDTPDAPDVLPQTASLLRATLMVDMSFYLGQGELSAKYVQAYHKGLIKGLTDGRSDWDDILKGML